MDHQEQEKFHYTYSAKEQDEIKAIRKKYTPQENSDDKMTQLRLLDAVATQKATAISLVFGIVGALLMGTGMSLVMTEIGAWLGTRLAMILGIGIGMIGIVLTSLAYPMYNHILKKTRAKIAPEIIKLTDELMK